MELKEVLDEALRQWMEFGDDRKDCTLEDYNNFILEIYGQLKEDEFMDFNRRMVESMNTEKNVIGNLEVVSNNVPSDIMIWNASTGFIHITEGSGCNLSEEDYRDGVIDYINYDFLALNGTEFTEQDGGQCNLKTLYQDKFLCISDVVNHLIEEGFIPNAVYAILNAQ